MRFFGIRRFGFPPLTALLIFCCLGIQSTRAANLKLAYQSPKNGSLFNSTWTSIIVKPGDSLKSASVQSSIFTVIGSISGLHSGKTTLASDQRTIIFKPTTQFANSERVTVQIRSGLLTTAGVLLGSNTFSFVISKSRHRTTALSDRSVGSSQNPDWDPSFSVGNQNSMSTLSMDTIAIDTLLNVDVNSNPPGGAIFLSSFQATLFKQTVGDYLLILANDGEPIFYRSMPAPCLDFKVQPNGMLTYYDTQRGYFMAMDSQYNVIDSFMCGDGYSTDEHDLELLPNHHALLFSLDTEVVNMAEYVTGGSPEADVIGCVVQEIDSLKNVVFKWRSWDYYRITDAIYQNLITSPIDYVHANAIQMDTDGNILLSSRHLFEITKISRDSGGIIWRLGGRHNEFKFLNDSIADLNNGLGFSYQHALRRIANGNLTLFDNGNYQKPQISRALEYRVDDQAKTCELVWQFQNRPEAYSPAMGYVQRLPNGNSLIGWGIISNPAVTEVRQDGSIAWQMVFAPPSVSYRAFRFPWNPSTAAVSHSAAPGSFSLSQNYPNPFGASLGTAASTIRYTLEATAHVTLTVYDVMGREVARLVDNTESAGDHHAVLKAGALPTGTYTYRLSAGGRTETRTMVLIH